MVRTLASGAHGARLLVHADGQSWAVRVLDHECPDEVIDHDVAVSDAALSGPPELSAHVNVVHDLCTTDDGRFALFEEYLAGIRLDVLLRARAGALGLGEAVTILAPLARAVNEGHRLGLTGLLLDTVGVRFRASGAPVLTQRATARLGPPLPDRFRDREPRYAADQDALERVGRQVAAALSDDDRAAFVAMLLRRPTELDRALFDLAEPTPVLLDCEQSSGDGEPSVAQSTRQSAVEPSPSEVVEPEPATVTRRRDRVRDAVVSALNSAGLPASVVSTVLGATDRVIDLVLQAAPRARVHSGGIGHRVRPRFVAAGLAGAAAVVVAVSLSLMSQAGSSESDAQTLAVVPHADDALGEAGLGDDGEERAFVPTLGLPETELHPEPDVWLALIKQLVNRWIDCAGGQARPAVGDERLRDSQDLVAATACSTAVVHENSAAASLLTEIDDRHRLLRDWQRGGGDAVVTERMGGAVLVDLILGDTTTASLLVVRSEAGWRIRDVIG